MGATEETPSLPAQRLPGLETSELLTLLLDSAGVDIRRIGELARAIDSGALHDAVSMGDESWMEDAGPSAAVALSAAFELTRRAVRRQLPVVIRGPADVAALACRELDGRRREFLLVIACDPSNRVLRSVVIAHGAIDAVPVPVREVLNEVLRCDARAFALAHNHPYGDPAPSQADGEATERVAEAARIVGLRFLGHVVVTQDGRWARISEGSRTTRS